MARIALIEWEHGLGQRCQLVRHAARPNSWALIHLTSKNNCISVLRLDPTSGCWPLGVMDLLGWYLRGAPKEAHDIIEALAMEYLNIPKL